MNNEIGLRSGASRQTDTSALVELEPRHLERKSELRYRRLFEAARDGILILNGVTGAIEEANPFMTELLGFTREQLLGKQLWEIGLFKDIDNNQSVFQRLQQNGVVSYDNLPLQRKDGTIQEVEFVSNLYRESDRPVIQCNIRDITDRRRLESEFLAILSHEFRNPLAALRYALPNIEHGILDESQKRALAVINRQLTHLVRLVDDLLDLTRLTTGKIHLERERVRLDGIVNAAVETVSPMMHAARHTFEVVTPEEPLWVQVDSERMSQVIGNLLTNAAKYTPPGGRIALNVRRENDQAVIRVTDNGRGIAQHQLPRLFDMFTQMNPEESQGGLGVGLTLAKHLVQLHDGTIEAHSHGHGLGAEFIVRLPLAMPPKTTRTGLRQRAGVGSAVRLRNVNG